MIGSPASQVCHQRTRLLQAAKIIDFVFNNSSSKNVNKNYEPSCCIQFAFRLRIMAQVIFEACNSYPGPISQKCLSPGNFASKYGKTFAVLDVEIEIGEEAGQLQQIINHYPGGHAVKPGRHGPTKVRYYLAIAHFILHYPQNRHNALIETDFGQGQTKVIRRYFWG